MKIRPLAIDGAYEITPVQHSDSRGVFFEWFKATTFRDAVGRDLELAQANCSALAAGVIRGIHFSDVPPGQAKYVFCLTGAILDVVVDVRVGSPTFGTWDSVLLDDTDRRGIFLEEGLGHAFMSLADGSTVVYLCSTPTCPAVSTACTLWTSRSASSGREYGSGAPARVPCSPTRMQLPRRYRKRRRLVCSPAEGRNRDELTRAGR